MPLPLWGGDADAGTAPRRVWHGDSVSLWGAPSPDGRWLSVVQQGTGAPAIRAVGSGTERLIAGSGTRSKGEFAYFSVFDRTGDKLAYAWFNSAGHYELRVAEIDPSPGSAGPDVLFSNPEVRFVQPCAWSHDGERILTLFFREDNTSQIALVDVDGGTVKILRSLHWIYPKRMDLSPDGRYVVYDNLSAADSSERDLYILRTDGSEERRLLDGPSDDQSPVWSFDGGTIWFVSDRGGSPAIWSAPLRNGAAAGPPRQLTGALPRTLLMGATRAGDVFVGRRTGGVRLYTQDWNTASHAPESEPVPATRGAPASERSLPVFLADGENIAFLAQVGTENQGREHSAVVVQSLATGDSAEIPTRLTFVRSMRFSPDGESVLLSGSDRRGRSGLFLHDRNSARTRPVELVEGDSLEGIPGAFGPQGDTLLLAAPDSADGALALVERRLDGQAPQRRIAGIPWRKRLTAVAPSPDGRRIALAWTGVEDAEGATVAMLERPDPRANPIMTLASGTLTDLAWAPGGSRIVVGTRGSAGSRLWLVRAHGESMTEIPSAKDRLPGLSFSPDGKRLAYAAGRTQEEVWVLAHGAATAR